MASFKVTLDQINSLTDERALSLLSETPVAIGPPSIRKQWLHTILQRCLQAKRLIGIDTIFSNVFNSHQPLHLAMQETYLEDVKLQPHLQETLKTLDSTSRALFYIFRCFVHIEQAHVDLFKPHAIPLVRRKAFHSVYGESTCYTSITVMPDEIWAGTRLLRGIMASTVPLNYRSLSVPQRNGAPPEVHRHYQTMVTNRSKYTQTYRTQLQPNYETDLRAYVMLRAWRIWQSTLMPTELKSYQGTYVGAPVNDAELVRHVIALFQTYLATPGSLPVERDYIRYILRLLKNLGVHGQPRLYVSDLTPGDSVLWRPPLEMFGTMAGGTGDALHTLIIEYGIPDDADIMERLSRD